MGRKGITKSDVVRAYVALIKQGRVLGPTNVRLELGRGSYSTISAHLKALAFVDGRFAVKEGQVPSTTLSLVSEP